MSAPTGVDRFDSSCPQECMAGLLAHHAACDRDRTVMQGPQLLVIIRAHPWVTFILSFRLPIGYLYPVVLPSAAVAGERGADPQLILCRAHSLGPSSSCGEGKQMAAPCDLSRHHEQRKVV